MTTKAVSAVPVKKLKARLSHYLAKARAGASIEVSSHKTVIARITGVAPPSAKGLAHGLQGLKALGVVDWRGGKPAGGRTPLSPAGKSLTEMLLEDR